ncbi:sulfurtransferase TusA family protein [Photobacterium indicum]|uniref:Sulfurtransferase TusA family protein n=1 Tax=Photobacterium indicum TaxID=81447 RepID=A0A2T3L8C5_9GAMM|nr:sulfurtransferase TusA family protein [Photobacterium indicum]PSV46946.1 sulfurtransferase TusA family protein [Photobacterium indicum]
MDIQTLNLASERCPLALLLAKRASKSLRSNQSIEIIISDAGARQDISRYLLNNGFNVKVQADSPQELVIIATKRQ